MQYNISTDSKVAVTIHFGIRLSRHQQNECALLCEAFQRMWVYKAWRVSWFTLSTYNIRLSHSLSHCLSVLPFNCPCPCLCPLCRFLSRDHSFILFLLLYPYYCRSFSYSLSILLFLSIFRWFYGISLSLPTCWTSIYTHRHHTSSYVLVLLFTQHHESS